MKFTLIFDGELPPSGNRNKRPTEKWDIRKKLEPQLIALWNTHPALSGIGLFALRPQLDSHASGLELIRVVNTPHTIRVDQQRELANRLRTPKVVGDKQFLPLVRKDLHLACSLDIHFLRQGEPGSVILPGGDLDNRAKTLFDALSVPNEQDLLGNPDHEPFLCLLEDDSLIIDQRIRTDRLLTVDSMATAPVYHPEHLVHLLIQVSVNVMRISDSNIGFLGD
jgi:hypothetical protein